MAKINIIFEKTTPFKCISPQKTTFHEDSIHNSQYGYSLASNFLTSKTLGT